jgi:hypothetical protein
VVDDSERVLSMSAFNGITWSEQEDEAHRFARPTLAWEGPDAEGDLIVRLVGAPQWSIAAHGKTWEEALHRLGGALELAGQAACMTCREHP